MKMRLPSLKYLVQTWQGLTQPLYWLYEQRLLKEVREQGRLPKHLGLILDGNRRFARSLGLKPFQGHDLGAAKVREVLNWCHELGINHVTLWVFSTDNRRRDPEEVNHLLNLFAEEAMKEAEGRDFQENGVKVTIIGNLATMPERVVGALRHLEAVTAKHDQFFLNVAVGYGGREEITHAVRSWLIDAKQQGATLEQAISQLDSDVIAEHLYTAGFPDPDFVIRTSGELRLSGFLLWQTAYSEFYFCDVFWPSFRKLDFLRAIRSFQARQRRFGR